MTILVNLENISLAYGLDLLLDHVNLTITAGERICLIGRNGAGKSSLLKIIANTLMPDSGFVFRKPHLRIARLMQELPNNITMSVYDFVAEGLAEIGELLSQYHSFTQQLTESHTDHDLLQLERLQREIDAKNGWKYEQNIKTILTRLALDPEKKLAELSGGWQRRAVLAQALVLDPDLLLLDEPTNHLDIEAIEWLEQALIASGTTIVFITHDRALLKRLATKIIELDRGQLSIWPGDYENFLRRKEEMLHAEAKQQADFDKKLAQEERWIRQGIKARRTRNEGRVRALKAMRVERAGRREVEGKVQFTLQNAEKSGDVVIEAKNIFHQFNDQVIVNHFSTRIMRGDRIGLIGPNGVGKTTLLNILLGNIKPHEGSVTLGTKLQIAYFDQQRMALDGEKSVMENVAQGQEFIEVKGKKQHIISYLGDFLFTPQRALTPVKALSGGECNRLLLAKLFTQPANLLIMDEPTNDLDLETLELLEELLCDYRGTLLLVSHDRDFLDQVVTSVLVFSGNGHIREYVGGYHDYLHYREQENAKIETTKKANDKKINDKKIGTTTEEPTAKRVTKLSYKEQKELTEAPQKIEQLENDLRLLQQTIADENFYKQAQNQITETLTKLAQLEKEIQLSYDRWELLENKQRDLLK